MTLPRLAMSLAIAIGLVPLGTGPIGAAALVPTACLDSSSPSYAVDARVVDALAKYGDPLKTFVFDGGEGVSERFFKYLSRTKCSIIMGFPVDLTQPDPPDGLALTRAYLSTAYVLAADRPLTQRSLKPGMTIAVGMATAPHFYLAGAFGSVPDYTADTFQTQEQALDALVAHKADVAMVWEPSVVRYERTHPARPKLHLAPLTIQHAQWKIAALYDEHDTAVETRFNTALAKLSASGDLAPITRPYALETTP